MPKGFLIFLVVFLLVGSLNASSMDELITRLRERSCQYTRKGVDFNRCKGHTQGMMTPLYYGLGFNPTTVDGFTLPLYKPSRSMPIIVGGFKRRVVNDACERSGFATIFDKVLGGGKNDFWGYSISDYSTAFGELLDINHECSITSSSFIAFDPNDQNPELDEDFVECVKMLTESPNDVLYSRFFETFGYFATFKGKYGGTKWETNSKSNNLGVVRGGSITSYSGGDPSLKDEQAWSMSILKNPTMTDFEISRMSDFVASLGIASPTVVSNLQSKEVEFFKTFPVMNNFEAIKEKQRPCKYYDFNILIDITEYTKDIRTVMKTYHYSKTRNPQRTTFGYCSKFSEASENNICNRFVREKNLPQKYFDCMFGCLLPGSKVDDRVYLLDSNADIREIAFVSSLLTPVRLENQAVVTMMTEYENIGPNIMHAVPTIGIERFDDHKEATHDKNFVCSPKRLPGMVPLDRYYHKGWGHTVGVPGNVEDQTASFEKTLCYVYPLNVSHRSVDKQGLKVGQICVEK